MGAKRWLAVLVLAVATVAARAQLVYRVDANHSNLAFTVPIMGGMSEVSGKFTDFQVNVKFMEKDVTLSSVDVTIHVASIDTGIAKRDAHLQTPEFFDAKSFPVITFKSRKVVARGDKLLVTGDFRMHGVSREITLEAIVKRTVVPGANKPVLLISFDTALNRLDFGIGGTPEDKPKAVNAMVGADIRIHAVMWCFLP